MQKHHHPPEIDRIRAVTLGVNDLERSLDFYTQKWGLLLVQRTKEGVWLRATGVDHHVLVLEKAQTPGLISITWGVSDQASLASLYERLMRAGVPTEQAPRRLGSPGGGWGFAFHDPEGRVHKVVSDREDHALESRDSTQPVKLAHVVVNTQDVEGMTQFLENTLGFQLSDSTLKMRFFRCNANHHSLALADFGCVSLNHIAFEMASWNDLMFGVGRMKLAGHAIEWGVGRHGPGDNVFSYFLDPDGQVVEYTAEVQQITNPHHVPGTPEQWARPPERMDQWGHAPLPSERIKKAMSGQQPTTV
jgi:catechol 2,3-dioxygenase